MSSLGTLLATAPITTGGWKWTGTGTTLDLIAASTNALNGALLARRPDHYKNYTVIGIMVMALLMGLGGGIVRDILLNQVPSAFTNPAYWVVAISFGVLGYLLAYNKGQLFREGFFQFVISFSLPWYAMVAAYDGVKAGLPVVAVIALGVTATTAGRWFVDVSSGVTPKHFIRGEWWIPVATLAASPLVLGDHVLVAGGGAGRAFLAFRVSDGKVVWQRGDDAWIRKAGGLFTQGGHVPSNRFNFGEKTWFWFGVTFLGIAVGASGLVLDFPNFEQTRSTMQIANIVHLAGALLFIVLSLGHIYMGTLGVAGAYDSMRTGYVDETWAKEHHEYWYEDMKSGKIPADVQPAPTTSARMA